MAMTNGPMVGKAQKFLWNTTYFVDGVDSMTFARKGETKETTCALTTQNVADKTFIGTLRDGTASLKLKYVNFGDTNGQLHIFNNVSATTPVACVLYLDAATKVTFSAIPTNFNTDEPVDGIASGSIDFQISGAITPAAV